jgi:hypothetical protein
MPVRGMYFFDYGNAFLLTAKRAGVLFCAVLLYIHSIICVDEMFRRISWWR